MVKLILTTVVLIVFSACMGYALALPLSIKIRTTQSSVGNDENLSIVTAIYNLSQDSQTIRIWSCGYDWHWETDNPNVRVSGISCDSNVPQNVVLKPGDIYERALWVHVSGTAETLQQKSVSFRLGFKPWTDKAAKPPSLIWSNPVSVKLKRYGQ